jgi:hypothetical protein
MRSGFTFIKNGEQLGYPFQESLLSLAPYVDEIIIAHGDSSDNTLNQLEILDKSLSCPLRIISSPWDPKQQKQGSELARQTNIALENCRHNICFYLQADEVLSDQDFEILHNDLNRFENDADVDALMLNWKHFFYTFDQVVHSRKWYRREIRVIKKDKGLKSFGDAQGFRICDQSARWSKPKAALSRAHVFHYGWVRPTQTMAEKTFQLDKLWHGEKTQRIKDNEVYKPQYGIQPFQGKHPKVMRPLIEKHMANFSKSSLSLKPKKNLSWLRYFLSDMFEKITGHRLGEFTNGKIVKKYE